MFSTSFLFAYFAFKCYSHKISGPGIFVSGIWHLTQQYSDLWWKFSGLLATATELGIFPA